MHLLIILLQQLLGMLPGSKKAPQAEVVRTRQPNSSSSESDAFQRLGVSQDGWMTVLRGHEGSIACNADEPAAVDSAAAAPAQFHLLARRERDRHSAG